MKRSIFLFVLSIAISNSKLKEIALGYSERGALAAAQKVSLKYKDGTTTVSLLNPLYMFHAYFQKDFNKKSSELTAETNAIKKVFSDLEFTFTPFGGDDHLPAMPYEIILQDNEATILHGRFRFALY